MCSDTARIEKRYDEDGRQYYAIWWRVRDGVWMHSPFKTRKAAMQWCRWMGLRIYED